MADGPRDRRRDARRQCRRAAVRGPRRGGGDRPGGAVGGAPAGGGARVARRGARPAQPHVRAPPGARARLLRAPADRPADVALDRRPVERPFLPRLRARVHRAVGADDPAGVDRHVPAAAEPGGAGAAAGALRRSRGGALRAQVAAGAAGGPAADRGADRRRRGERVRRAGREGVRGRGAAARPLPRHRHPRLRPVDDRHPAAGLLQPVHRLPAEPRARGRAAGGRAPGGQRLADAGRLHGLLRLPADAHQPDAAARHRARHGAAGDRLGGADLRAARPRAGARGARGRPAAAGRRGARGDARRVVLLQRLGTALRDIDLAVEAGTTVALVGATGSGKSTLVQLLGRLYDVDAGSVRVDGADVRDVDLRSLRSEIAVVDDDPFLFSASVHDNIAYARPDASREDVERAARAGAGGAVHRGAAGRLRHARRRARPDSVGRPAPADRDRARAAGRPAHPRARRRHELGRRLDRAGDQGRRCAR